MSTDWYPDEEGVILDGISIGWAQCSAAVTAGCQIKLTTATSGNIVIAVAADHEGIGIAMRAGASSDYVPVLFYGVYKMVLGNAITAGDPVASGTTANVVIQALSATIDQELKFHGLNYTGTYEILGRALQGGTTNAEALILIAPL